VDTLEEVRTPRLLLRRVREEDWAHLRRMDTDPAVMATLGGVRSDEQTRAYVEAQLAHWDEHGFGWWMAFEGDSARFVGRGGLRFLELEDRRDVEVGYGLLKRCWGRGLATELAAEAVRIGFDVLGLPRVIGVTLPTNAASRRVLEKVGLRHVGDTVYKVLPHVLYERVREEGGEASRGADGE
jgi:ribosomal-protein-alanine N-acetyltransferase